MPSQSVRVEGDIVFQELTAPFAHATVYVRLLDVSRADAASEVVAKSTIEDVSMESPASLHFALSVPALSEAQRRYSLSAHVDLDNSGSVSPGDYLSMESVPVSASSRGPVVVPVRPVR